MGSIPVGTPGINPNVQTPGQPQQPTNVLEILKQVLGMGAGMSTLPQGVPPVINQTQMPNPRLSPQIRPELNYGGNGQEFATKGGRQRQGMERLFGNAAKMVEAASKNKEQKETNRLALKIERAYGAIAQLNQIPKDQQNASNPQYTQATEILNEVFDANDKDFKKLKEVFDINYLQDKRDPKVVQAEQKAKQRFQAMQGSTGQGAPQSQTPPQQAQPPAQPQPPQAGAPPQGQQTQPQGLNPAAAKFLQMMPQQQVANPLAEQMRKQQEEMVKTMSPMAVEAMRATGAQDVARINRAGAMDVAIYTQNSENFRKITEDITKNREIDERTKVGMARVGAELKKADAIMSMSDGYKYANALKAGSQLLGQQLAKVNADIQKYKAIESPTPSDTAKLKELQQDSKNLREQVIEYNNGMRQSIIGLPQLIQQNQQRNNNGGKPNTNGQPQSGIPQFPSADDVVLRNFGIITAAGSTDDSGENDQ